ncbi:calsyntenin-1-like [Saccostrea echinata]|uniref:calsyntenin-1-like n=1 Tax=Saccostrea echinata TaxID=191078 RepID=UPI002A833E4B|nr:calsyntenin-1-like [Saccostrea echinata]
MKAIWVIGATLILMDFISGMSETNAHDPVINSKLKNGRGFPVFHGNITEGSRVVQLDQPLKATDEDTVGGARYICGYRLISPRKNIPFTVELLDRTTGEAQLKVADGRKVSFEKRKRYKFSVIAYDCGQPARESNRAVIFVRVEDVDRFAPTFDKPDYAVDLEEDRLYDPLFTLHAHDKDRSKEFRQICEYELETPNVPFSVDRNGNIRNTEKVYYRDRHNFILKIIARDCGGRKSKAVFINVLVREKCKPQWTNFPDHLQYLAGSGKQRVAPKASLRWCDDTCTPDQVTLQMQLATKHIGKGCDRDTFSISSQRKLCGANDHGVDLLPSPSLTSSWTRFLPTDDGKESDQVFYFDGENNAVEVPENIFNHTLHKHFSIMMWMKHEHSEIKGKKYPKEHILCMSDGDNMNRHHYSLFVHGDKLVLLVRREAADASDMEVFKPAEWRWKISEINQRDEWHHYAISMNFPHVQLFVDGNLVIPSDENSEVVDDWPLHKTNKVHDTKLIVGACWEGGHHKFNHYFRGYLAGLSILKGKTESERVIRCLNNCQENLDFSALSAMHSGTTVSFNRQMTDFRIQSKNVSEVQALLREVHYINSRKFPTPGRRNLTVSTAIHCGSVETFLPKVDSYILVRPAATPSITLRGHPSIRATEDKLKAGVRIFEDINISVDFAVEKTGGKVNHILGEDEIKDGNSDIELGKEEKLQLKLERKKAKQDTISKVSDAQLILLDMCTVKADPPLDLYHERLELPTSIMNEFNMKIEGTQTSEGLVISNADNIEDYVLVLRGILYVHEKDKPFTGRSFHLSCSSQNGRFISNFMDIKVIKVEEENNVILPMRAQQAVQHIQLPSVSGTGNMAVGAASPNVGMVAIIVVCVGFLLFMIILGVIRIRAAHRRTQVVQVEPEMEWDNEMNLTVNPMDEETHPLHVFDYDEGVGKSMRDDSDSEDDCSSYHEEEGDDSSDEETVPKKELEWDNEL